MSISKSRSRKSSDKITVSPMISLGGTVDISANNIISFTPGLEEELSPIINDLINSDEDKIRKNKKYYSEILLHPQSLSNYKISDDIEVLKIFIKNLIDSVIKHKNISDKIGIFYILLSPYKLELIRLYGLDHKYSEYTVDNFDQIIPQKTRVFFNY